MQPGPGYIHFPRDEADDEYFAQLAAEKLVVKHRMGRASQEWVQTRPRNEALDCMVYALAALRLWGGLEKVTARKERAAAAVPGEAPPLSPARQRLAEINRKHQRRLGSAAGFVGAWKN